MLTVGAYTCDELVDLDPSALCDSEIRAAHVDARRLADRLEATAARLLAAAGHRGLPLGDGASSTAVWSQIQTGQRYPDAKASLDAGLACEHLPLVGKAWAQGEISASAARTICRGRRAGHEGIYASIEETLVEFAAKRDFRAVDSMIRHYQSRADALDEIDPADRNGVQLSAVGNRFRLSGDLDQLAGRTLSEAIGVATDKPSADDARGPAKRRADALEVIARFFLEHHDSPLEGGERPHVSVVLTWQDLRGQFSDREWAEYADSGFSPAALGRLLCDARIARVVLGPTGVPLDVGRATYAPSKPLRRAVTVRDGGCRFPGCHRRPSWCETHHVDPWEDGGITALVNIVLLCSFHHHLVHKPRWHATFDGLTFTITRPDGTTDTS